MTRLGVKQVLKLDYTIEDPQERNKLVEQIIAETPDINDRYLEILGDYLMNGIEKQDNGICSIRKGVGPLAHP